MTFDWNASYEWLAEEFRKETGLMAPAKDDAIGDNMAERRKAWRDWFESRHEQAWKEWHGRHGMFAGNGVLTKDEFEQAEEMTHQLAESDAQIILKLLAAHSAGAQGEPVGTAVNDEELGRFWEMHKPASEFPVGTHVYTHPQPMPQTDAARHAMKRASEICREWSAKIDAENKRNRVVVAAMQGALSCAALIDAEIERIDRAKGE